MSKRLAQGLAGATICALLLGLWLANVSRPGHQESAGPSGNLEPTRKPGPLRILSLNMLHGFPRFHRLRERLDLLASEIVQRDVDLVLLQEVPWTLWTGNGAGYLAKRTGMGYAYLRANGNRRAILFEEGAAILSRFPLQETEGIELPPRASLFEHRIALSALLETPWAKLHVVSTHLTNGADEINQGQVRALARFVAGLGSQAVIIGGDFNAGEESAQIRELAWVDLYRAVNPDSAGPTCCIRNPTKSGKAILDKRIDYLFLQVADGQIRPLSCTVILSQPVTGERPLWVSDHAGLLAELEVSSDANNNSSPLR